MAVVARKAAIKEAIIKRYRAFINHVGNKTTIGGIAIDRTFKGNRRLTVVELNIIFRIQIGACYTYYTATEFRARTDSTGNS